MGQYTVRDSDKSLQETVEEVFSLVPSDEAVISSREVVSRYLRNDTRIISSLCWAEFQLDGRFVRGGVSNIDSMSSRLIFDKTDDDVSGIVEDAADNGLHAGRLTPTHGTNGFIWCIPYTPATSTELPTTLRRLILVTEELFFEILRLFNSTANLTAAEQRMVYQLMMGFGPGEAAVADNVSVETKRSQLKKASSKLHCTGQLEIVRLLMGQMIHILYLCEAETSHMDATEKFTTDFLGNYIKLSAQRLSNGRLMRYWELGPQDGTPVLLIHGYLFPILLLNAKAQLEQHKLRLIAPIRGGYLDNQTYSDVHLDGGMIEKTVEDLTLFVKQVCPKPIPVVGHATGGFYAMLIAKLDGDLFSKIIIPSINLMKINSDSRSFSSSFFGGIRKLAGETDIYDTLVRQFQKTTFSNKQATKFVLRRLFKGCEIDVGVLNGKYGAGQCFDWYQALHRNSPLGIAGDFRLASRSQEAVLREVPEHLSIHFLHGPNDIFTHQDLIRKFATNHPSADVTVLKEGCHLAAASHPELMWDVINSCISEVPNKAAKPVSN